MEFHKKSGHVKKLVFMRVCGFYSRRSHCSRDFLKHIYMYLYIFKFHFASVINILSRICLLNFNGNSGNNGNKIP